MAEWVRALAWAGDRTVSRPGSNPATATSLRNFGNSVYPALPVSFGGDTKSRRSLLSGVYARGSKRSHQSALECVTVVDSTTHSKLPDLQSAIMRRKTLPCTCIGRRRRRTTTKLYGTSTCGCNNNTIFLKNSNFNVSYRRHMPRMLAWRRAGLGHSCQSGNMAILLTSLLFVFEISFLPKYGVNYYDYIIKWCFGI